MSRVTYPADVAAAAQSFTPGKEVELFILDLNPIGVAQQYYFTPTNNNGVEIALDGQTYTYTAIALTGLEWSADGDPPSPKLMMPNGNKFTSSLVTSYQDGVGAKITRMRTYAQFLDGGAQEDPDALLSTDVFIVEQKVSLNRVYGEFSLRPVHSMEHRKIPNRVCLKEICTWRYRVYDSGSSSFDYSQVQCPYAGSNYFDAQGNATTAENDQCSKQLETGCLKRYPNAGDELPFGGFPGMSRVRIS